MTQQRNSRKPNGLPGPHGRPNGHAPACAPARPAGGERGGAPGPVCTDRLHGHAAFDDASGISVASAEALPATASLPLQASTGRTACADAAPPAPNETPQVQASSHNQPGGDGDKPEEELPPGKYPLPDNPAEFVEEIHRGADLFIAWQELLNSKDEKVKQRAAEKLTEMRYKGAAALAEEPQPVVFDIDSAVARRAAEGARK